MNRGFSTLLCTLLRFSMPAVAGLLTQFNVQGAPLILSDRRIHLGTQGSPEWEWFAGDAPEARRLDLRFNAKSNDTEFALFIRQDDVRQDWSVQLNGQPLGKLFLMEADLVQTLPIPRGKLRDGENVLSLLPPKENDDILLHQIQIEPRSVSETLSESTLTVEVSDLELHRPIPCRITVVEAHGSLAALLAPTNRPGPPLAVRPGVVYTGNGAARVLLPHGDYTVHASRGFEWSVATQLVHVAAGETGRLSLALRREVPTSGYVSCDTHVHTFTYSRHGDASLDERMLTLAGEGIELPVATDHNLNIDYTEAARRAGVAELFTPITGNEITTPTGHFNLFPVPPDATVPDFKLTNWPRLMQAMRGTPGTQVIVLNHPRNVHNEFQPFAATNFNNVTGDNKRGPEFSFDAMELLNSSAQQTDPFLVLRDWFALLNHGYRIAAVGSSDSHDVSRYIVGQGRTYIACPDADPGRLNASLACSNLVAGRALVSMGLLVQMTVNEVFGVGDLATGLGDSIRVQLKVLGPSWVSATNVMLFANGVKIRETTLTASNRVSSGVQAVVNWVLPRFAQDVHLVAFVTGPEVTAPFWAIPRPYQPSSTRWTGHVIAATNPIWMDADNDGHFTAARGYAQKLIEENGSSPAKLIPKLSAFDEAVAAQAAGLCASAGADLQSAAFGTALKSAASQVQHGFAAYIATLAR